MAKKPKHIDEYLENLEGTFAYPILTRAREVIQKAAPQLEEHIKWGAPSLEYKGMVITLAAFKTHAAIWFHKGALLRDEKGLLEASSEDTKAMRKYVLKSLDDLDEAGLQGLVVEAVEKNENGEQVQGFNTPSTKYTQSKLLNEALKGEPLAKENFEALTPFKQREYIEHIERAKRTETQQRRLEKALEMLTLGKGLHDKYRK
jgi:uncharacterized protein YdeI (YjbR/CyaY-like superfamily)